MSKRTGIDFQKASYVVGTALHIESPLVIGLAIHLSWLCLLLAPDITLSAYAPFLSSGACLALSTSFLLGFSAGCLLTGIMRGVITYYLRKKIIHLLIGLVGAACLLGVLVIAAQDPHTGLALIGWLLSALTGAACAVTTLIWGEAARRRELGTLAIATLISLVLAAFLILLLTELSTHNRGVFVGLACACPLASVIFMYKAQHDNESYLKPQEFVIAEDGVSKPKEGQTWAETSHELRISKRGFALRIGRSALPFGLALGLMLGSVAASATGPDAVARLLEAGAVPLLGAIAFILISFTPLRRAEQPLSVRRTLPFFVALLLLAAGAPGGTEPCTLAALLFAAFALLWLFPTEITKQYRITPMLTFGFSGGFLALGVVIARAVIASPGALALPPSGFVVLCALLFLLGCAGVITDEQMRSIVILDAPAAAQGHGEDTAAESPVKRPFRERCQLTADIFLLSHRELDILYLLAKGRNAAAIQHELVISEGTVRTHMRNIYHKLGVHSQQELMDLVEGITADQDTSAGRR